MIQRDSRKARAEAIAQEKSLQVCARHPKTVYYDEPECPACRASRELLKLTSEMFPSAKSRE
jgi:hypothetical protein